MTEEETINQIFAWLKEGEKRRDDSTSFTGKPSSLAHQLGSYGWVKRDLQLALCAARPRYGQDQLRFGTVTQEQIDDAESALSKASSLTDGVGT